MFSVDSNTCNGCSICSEVCPAGCIDLHDGLPSIFPDNKKMCIRCGHCEVYCPSSAINLSFRGNQPFDAEITFPPISSEQLAYYIASRRSVRNYKKQAANKETISKLMDMVRYAPTAKNVQNVGWIIVTSQSILVKLRDLTANYLETMLDKVPEAEALYLKNVVSKCQNGVDLILWDAPCLAVVHETAKNASSVNGNIAATYFDLAAATLGLGCCWLGYFHAAAAHSEEIQNLLTVPSGHRIKGAIAFGYPKYKTFGIPKRKSSRVTWL